MKRSIARALFLDAFYQVLDNKVFRLLAVLAALLVLPTFVVGARPQGLVLFYGLRTVPWRDIPWLTGGSTNHELIVQRLQELVVSGLAGTLGIFFAIAATAFFVPRMLEKGAADVVFSRPVGRTTLLLARYCAGVLFVALLATALVVGMHCGLRLVSGTSDPAFLWSIPTIVYVFALVHAVSLVTGVFARSSVAAILATMLFFAVNGGLHQGWILAEYFRDQLRQEQTAAGATGEVELDAPRPLLRLLDGLHFALPKTTDAHLIVRKLRKAILESPPVLRDEAGELALLASPPGLRLAGPGGAIDLAREPARWSDATDAGEGLELELRREARLQAGKRRSARTAAKELVATLEKSGVVVAQPEGDTIAGLRCEFVHWSEEASGGRVGRSTACFASGDWLFVLESRQRGDDAATRGRRLRELLGELRVESSDPDPFQWYERRLEWDAPLRHNIWFSVGSSLLFALLLFALACWKLKRIDF